ncbi:MAG: DegT/DnrJ/EryC1/StrS family aminotransferase [Elusimicrobiota bacterium]|nr:DegT/DnrJ/EryC1/StrS family aminotransferase [Elusimicrobiota bacterium]
MIPVNEPLLKGNELAYVTECIKTGWISSAGRFIEQFEQKWSAYCGMEHGVSMCNGTVALQAAVAALELKPGDEIIMPSFTIISCALAAVYNGAKPVLVDCDPETWTMDPAAIEAKINPKTRAIMPVHIYGHPCDMDPILALAKKHSLAVIEDAAEAHGAEYKGRKCGSFGDISCFSFYANKIITAGEGGMALTSNPVYAERLKAQRNLCFRPERRFFHTELGHNFRITNMQAAVALAQMEQIEEFLKKKRAMARAYQEKLKGVKGLTLPVEKDWAKNVYWMYGLVLDGSRGMDAVQFAKLLSTEGVETRPFFLGLHEQPVFHDMGLFRGERYPVTERIAANGLYLPSGLAITPQQIEQAADAVVKVLA